MSKLLAGALDGDAGMQYQYAYRLMTMGEKGDLYRKSSFDWFYTSARQGYAPAQVAMGSFYQCGLAGEFDWNRAHYWYRLAAKQRNVFAYQGLISLNLAKNDWTGAAPWIKLLALEGDIDCCLVYASMLTEGKGLERNDTQAVDFWRYAAMSGNEEACLMMASCYASGWGVPVNARLSHLWWKMSRDCSNEI